MLIGKWKFKNFEYLWDEVDAKFDIFGYVEWIDGGMDKEEFEKTF